MSETFEIMAAGAFHPLSRPHQSGVVLWILCIGADSSLAMTGAVSLTKQL